MVAINFELGRWGDGRVHLYHEDLLHGQDIDIVLEDGKAILLEWDGDDLIEVPIEEGLAKRLVALLERAK
jgi:hypothetical protein